MTRRTEHLRARAIYDVTYIGSADIERMSLRASNTFLWYESWLHLEWLECHCFWARLGDSK